MKNALKEVIYFFTASSWIANFGVVPLFLLAAFLLAPALTLLLDLTFFKIFVFETINHLPTHCIAAIYIYYTAKYLLIFKHYVKVLLLLLLIFLPQNSLGLPLTHGPLSGGGAKIAATQSFVISKGEHLEIPVPGLARFTVGNKEVISHKYRPSSQKMLIKGAKQGLSELIIWRTKGKKRVYKIYVLSKLKYLKFLHLTETIGKIGLTSEIAGPIIIVTGEVKTLESYRLLKKIARTHKKILHIKAHLAMSLKNDIIGKVYKSFFSEYIDKIQCNFENISIYCRYPASNTPSKATLKALKARYFVLFSTYPDRENFRNFKVQLKLIQIEKTNGEEFNFGLDQLSGELGELFQGGPLSIIEKNKFIFGKKNLRLSTLAESELLIKLGVKGGIEVGSSIPFQVGTSETSTSSLKWKFSGLKIQLTLLKKGKDLQLKYKTEFTKASNNNSNISGSKESGTAIVPLNEPLQLFQIGLKTFGENTGQLPWASRIPLLGRIFKSTSTRSTYKKISGIIKIQEMAF